MSASDDHASDMQDSFESSGHDIPSAKDRERLSVVQLAELMVNKPKESVPYIVLSHELNLKIAKLQAKATLSAGWYGAIAAVFAALLTLAIGYFIGTSKSKELNQPVTQPTATCNQTQNVTAPLPPKNENKASK